jgi:carboxymethylenebutenolidase
MTLTARQQLMSDVWDEHTRQEFEEGSAEGAVQTLTDDVSVRIVPLDIGASGKQQVLEFYKNSMVCAIPPDMEATLLSRTIDEDRIADELTFTFTHTLELRWILPGIAPTGHVITLPHVVIIDFRGDLISAERVYWDQAAVYHQAGVSIR